MKNCLLILMVLMAITLFGADAHALSIEQKDNMNSDGTPKFADPDEQAPAFLVTPNTTGAGSSALDPSERSVNGPSVPDMLGVTRQSDDAFDRAASHLQNQNR